MGATFMWVVSDLPYPFRRAPSRFLVIRAALQRCARAWVCLRLFRIRRGSRRVAGQAYKWLALHKFCSVQTGLYAHSVTPLRAPLFVSDFALRPKVRQEAFCPQVQMHGHVCLLLVLVFVTGAVAQPTCPSGLSTVPIRCYGGLVAQNLPTTGGHCACGCVDSANNSYIDGGVPWSASTTMTSASCAAMSCTAINNGNNWASASSWMQPKGVSNCTGWAPPVYYSNSAWLGSLDIQQLGAGLGTGLGKVVSAPVIVDLGSTGVCLSSQWTCNSSYAALQLSDVCTYAMVGTKFNYYYGVSNMSANGFNASQAAAIGVQLSTKNLTRFVQTACGVDPLTDPFKWAPPSNTFSVCITDLCNQPVTSSAPQRNAFSSFSLLFVLGCLVYSLL